MSGGKGSGRKGGEEAELRSQAQSMGGRGVSSIGLAAWS